METTYTWSDAAAGGDADDAAQPRPAGGLLAVRRAADGRAMRRANRKDLEQLKRILERS